MYLSLTRFTNLIAGMYMHFTFINGSTTSFTNRVNIRNSKPQDTIAFDKKTKEQQQNEIFNTICNAIINGCDINTSRINLDEMLNDERLYRIKFWYFSEIYPELKTEEIKNFLQYTCLLRIISEKNDKSGILLLNYSGLNEISDEDIINFNHYIRDKYNPTNLDEDSTECLYCLEKYNKKIEKNENDQFITDKCKKTYSDDELLDRTEIENQIDYNEEALLKTPRNNYIDSSSCTYHVEDEVELTYYNESSDSERESLLSVSEENQENCFTNGSGMPIVQTKYVFLNKPFSLYTIGLENIETETVKSIFQLILNNAQEALTHHCIEYNIILGRLSLTTVIKCLNYYMNKYFNALEVHFHTAYIKFLNKQSDFLLVENIDGFRFDFAISYDNSMKPSFTVVFKL